jgi:hypothetical protein
MSIANSFVGVLGALLLGGAAAPAADRAAAPGSALVSKLDSYRRSLQDLVPFHERASTAASRRLATRQGLFREGLISRVELEGAEREVREARRKLEETRASVAETDNMIEEARLAAEIEKGREPETGETVIRYAGTGPWNLAKLGKVESFFSTRFGHALPVSAAGQTRLHDRMGFAHHDAIDVAVHPDSSEGQQLMDYLRQAGIPFIAFRSALPGSATGAHIHVGPPSLRLTTA